MRPISLPHASASCLGCGMAGLLALLFAPSVLAAGGASSSDWLDQLPALLGRIGQDPLGVARELAALWQGLPAWPLAGLLFGLLTLWSATGIPGCSVLLLAIGARYGLGVGTLLVTLATTLGAAAPFLLTRHCLRERVQARHGARMARVDAVLQRHGPVALLALRLAPVLPYQLLNPLMGLSAMPLGRYLLWTAVGMAASSAAYVQMGCELGSARALRDLFAPGLGLALALLLVLSWGAQRWWQRAQQALAPRPEESS